MKRMPSAEQIGTAVLWLQSNDGDMGESEACKAVAEWIDWLRGEATLRNNARTLGMTPASLRRSLLAAINNANSMTNPTREACTAVSDYMARERAAR